MPRHWLGRGQLAGAAELFKEVVAGHHAAALLRLSWLGTPNVDRGAEADIRGDAVTATVRNDLCVGRARRR